jgi:hypothetical protein
MNLNIIFEDLGIVVLELHFGFGALLFTLLAPGNKMHRTSDALGSDARESLGKGALKSNGAFYSLLCLPFPTLLRTRGHRHCNEQCAHLGPKSH